MIEHLLHICKHFSTEMVNNTSNLLSAIVQCCYTIAKAELLFPTAVIVPTGRATRNGHLAAQSSRKGVAFLPKDVRLTKKQEELRIKGLRILARMMVRAYLKDLADANRGVSQNGVSAESQREAEQDVG